MASNIASAYHVKCEAGNVGMSGAPILTFALVVIANTGKCSGHAEITQALPPPLGSIEINNVTGQIHGLGLPPAPAKRVVILEGNYWQPGPDNRLHPFRAAFTVDDAWNGFGGFEYGGHTVSNVPVKQVD
jgi:Domain of unknown function (DUF1842)